MLELTDLTVRFTPKRKPAVLALDNVSLTVEDNQFSVIVGPSGCGKSTLLRLVAGLQEQTSGTMLLDGQPIAGLFAAGRSACGLPRWGEGYSSGLSIGDSTFFGRQAGRSAATR